MANHQFVVTKIILKGKPIGTTDPNGGQAALLRRMLAANGLPSGSYSLVQLATPDAVAAGVMNGTVAAALLDQPRDSQLIDQRFKSLGQSTEVAPEYQAEAVATLASWARNNEDGLTRFLRALVEADAWLYDATNRSEAIRILSEFTKSTPSASERSYQLLIEKNQAVAKSGEVSLPGLKTAIELMAELDLLKRPTPAAEKYVDTSYLNKARRLQR